MLLCSLLMLKFSSCSRSQKYHLHVRPGPEWWLQAGWLGQRVEPLDMWHSIGFHSPCCHTTHQVLLKLGAGGLEEMYHSWNGTLPLPTLVGHNKRANRGEWKSPTCWEWWVMAGFQRFLEGGKGKDVGKMGSGRRHWGTMRGATRVGDGDVAICPLR